MNISDPRLAVATLRQMRDRVHEMRLAQTHSAVQKQRVIGAPEVLRDLQRCSFCELVALALDEGAEAEVRIQARADDQAFGASRPDRGIERRGDRRRSSPLR